MWNSTSYNQHRGRGLAWGSSRASSQPSDGGEAFRRGRHAFTRTEAPVSTKPYGPELDSINSTSLLIEENAPKINNVKYVASYNWLDAKSPIILVPGSPPAWTPPLRDEKLPPDSPTLKVYRDINAARHAAYPMEPTIRSLLALEPEFDIKALDLVACGSTAGNLLRFASSIPKPFRFDVDLIEDTVFFIRKENTPTETIEDLRGYGHTFPERYTTWDKNVAGSCSHQRIIEYDFGGLRFLIRSETDAYIKQSGSSTSSGNAKPAVHSSLDEMLSNIGLGTAVDGPLDGSKLSLRLQGEKVPQSQIFDIKTRRALSTFDIEELIPRLWVNQTPKFLIAYHQFGLFDKPDVLDVKQKVLDWEKRNTKLLSRYHAIVKRILDIVRDSDDHQVEVSWDGQGPLRITKQVEPGNRVLPSELLHRWADDV